MPDGSATQVYPAATLADLAAMRRFIAETAVSLAVPDDPAGDMLLAATEAAGNILRHGYGERGAYSGCGDITIGVSRAGRTFAVTLRDKAPCYDPTERPPPDTTLPLAGRMPGGMGVHVMRTFTHAIRHRALSPAGNELTLIIYLAGE
jgi:anti-sigma regulatory factor (Ser/Thr protein kinase)